MFCNGLHLKLENQSNIEASYSGEVIFAGENKEYGNMIKIRHKKGYYSLYSGLETLSTIKKNCKTR